RGLRGGGRGSRPPPRCHHRRPPSPVLAVARGASRRQGPGPGGPRTRKPAFRLQPGQRVQVLAPPADPLLALPEAIPLAVVYEDADVLVIDKPAGLTVHPAPGHPGGTLVNAVLARATGISGIGGALRPGLVQRMAQD